MSSPGVEPVETPFDTLRDPGADLPRDSRSRRIMRMLRRALVMELQVYASIGRAIVRKPAIPAGASGFSHHKPLLMILIVFIVLSAVEIPIIDLIVHQWLPVRIGFLALGIWGLTWMIGLLCAFLTKPHTVGPRGIQVREGLEIDLDLPWDVVATIGPVRRMDEPKAPRVAGEPDGTRVLAIRVQNETNVEVTLESRTTVRLPGSNPKGGIHVVDAVRFWVDEPKEFLAAVRAHIP